ncbi:EpsG family protein [Klebsiella pneumoniae]|uniref:EpsG family protein n=1 Tax=Klebsiella pneumoniae TaxID=573 RepID=UPI000A3B45B1|nr:EpsG family protein [Klebsiella pneumoniae]
MCIRDRNLVLGIRYGAAMVFIIYAITCFYSRSKARFAVFSCLSLLMHFSMIFILICFLGSRYIKIKKIYIIPLVFIFYFLSSFVLRSVLPGISFMGVGDYAMGGYVDGVWSEIPTDTNTLILAYLSRGLGILALFFYPHLDVYKRQPIDLNTDEKICIIKIEEVTDNGFIVKLLSKDGARDYDNKHFPLFINRPYWNFL